MTDQYDPSGQIPRRARTADGGAAAGGALALILAAIAVVAGFFILNSLSDGGVTADFPNEIGNAAGGQTADTAVPGSAVTTAPPSTVAPTTVPFPYTDGASVAVVNANNVGGSAGKMSEGLGTVGYTMGKPTNVATAVGTQKKTKVVYDSSNANAQAVAESVAKSLGGVTAEALSGKVPTVDGAMNGAHVLVLLGNDLAGKTPADITPAVAPANTAPTPAAGTTATTAASGG